MSCATQLQDQREATDAAARAGLLSQATAPRDNPIHRALFSLPPIRSSSETAVAVVEAPPQKIVTGDVEVDAVLWLREVISTGQADLIAKAKEAAVRIKTPLKELEKRYTEHLRRANPGNPFATFAAIGFDDLDGLSAKAITRAARQHEARTRFGDSLFDDTPAEMFCKQNLKRVKRNKGAWSLDEEIVDKRFDAQADSRPSTLLDCVAELTYWRELYWLRRSVGECGDTCEQVNAREDYVFRMLSRIPPRTVDEAALVFHYLTSNDGMGRAHTGAIILNLIGAPEPYKAKQGDAE